MLYLLKMNEGDSMVDHLNDFNLMVSDGSGL